VDHRIRGLERDDVGEGGWRDDIAVAEGRRGLNAAVGGVLITDRIGEFGDLARETSYGSVGG
jgi:hypothetical protein